MTSRNSVTVPETEVSNMLPLGRTIPLNSFKVTDDEKNRRLIEQRISMISGSRGSQENELPKESEISDNRRILAKKQLETPLPPSALAYPFGRTILWGYDVHRRKI